jgi:acetyl esterase/lipase
MKVCGVFGATVVAAMTLSMTMPAAATAQATQPPRPGGGRGGNPPLNTQPREMPLWENGAPGALGQAEADTPTLTVYPARRSSGTAIVIAPGGGYGALAMDHEGRQVASFFNSMGVTAFVLKYRLGPRYHHPIELGDALRAMRMARAGAQEFNINPQRIGIMGFSAGGHLASTVATHFDAGTADAADPIDRVSSRPDFLILGYPVISSDPAIAHAGSFRNLLGENPDPALLKNLSNDLQVTPETPPTFIFHTNADTGVVAENSVRFYLALRQAKVPAELHIFENGPHGVGLAMDDPALSFWPTLLANWLRGRGLLTR